MTPEESGEEGAARPYPPYLRLVWSNPNPPRRRPTARVNLALAIERHLAGHDGLSEEEFLTTYSGRLSPSRAPSPS